MTSPNNTATREQLIRHYDFMVQGVEERAEKEEDRAYGGVIRSVKGTLLEQMTPHIVRLAWADCGGALPV